MNRHVWLPVYEIARWMLMKSIVRIQHLKLPEINLQSPCNQTRMHVKINEEAWLPNAPRC